MSLEISQKIKAFDYIRNLNRKLNLSRNDIDEFINNVFINNKIELNKKEAYFQYAYEQKNVNFDINEQDKNYFKHIDELIKNIDK